jgi:hypothetical protein
MKKLNEQELEQLIHSTLRSLPARRAPRSLEARVLAAIEQQAMIPWYHKSWSYWPAAVRAAFLVGAAIVSTGTMVAFNLMSQGAEANALAQAVTSRFQFVTQLFGAAAWTIQFIGRSIGSIPPLWLYGGLATFAALYATFFGLGAAAYRTLHRSN